MSSTIHAAQDANQFPALIAHSSTDENAEIVRLVATDGGALKLLDTLQELIQRLAPLAGAINNTAQLRVMQTSVPSTAVTGPITSALSIAEKAVGGISYAPRVAQENLTAIMSNINNVVIT